jgi:hypothetical protein
VSDFFGCMCKFYIRPAVVSCSGCAFCSLESFFFILQITASETFICNFCFCHSSLHHAFIDKSENGHRPTPVHHGECLHQEGLSRCLSGRQPTVAGALTGWKGGYDHGCLEGDW